VETRNSRCIFGSRGFRLADVAPQSGTGKVGAREADGGERWKRELGKIDVVEADDAEIRGTRRPSM